MSRPHRRLRKIELTVLDALRLATMPADHRTMAMAAMIRRGCEVKPTPSAGSILSMFAEPDEVEQLLKTVFDEAVRQEEIANRRASRHLNSDPLDRNTRPTKGQRLNRLCSSMFGPVSTWLPLIGTNYTTGRPVYNWLTRDRSGTMIAGVDHLTVDECYTGFVIKSGCGVLVQSLYTQLPTRPTSYRDLMIILGLPHQFWGNEDIGVDWRKRAFILSRTNTIPWVYP